VYKDSSGWHAERVDDVGIIRSMALDAGDYPHIVCSSGGGDPFIRYAYKDNTGWHAEIVSEPMLPSIDLETPCIVLDAYDNPYISYNSTFTACSFISGIFACVAFSTVEYAEKNIFGWQLRTLDRTFGCGVFFFNMYVPIFEMYGLIGAPSIALGVNDHSHIVYGVDFYERYSMASGLRHRQSVLKHVHEYGVGY
jgi:hypothetical protein